MCVGYIVKKQKRVYSIIFRRIRVCFDKYHIPWRGLYDKLQTINQSGAQGIRVW